MASFCAKCGTELSPDKQFCTSCGAPAAAVQGVAQPIAPQPVAPPPSSGSSALKIILIIVAIFVGLGILAASVIGYGIWRATRAFHVSGNGEQMSMSTPEGTLNLNASESYSEADLGTAIYPGAEAIKGGMKMSLPTGSMVTGIFVTSDSKDQVVTFYKDKFGSDVAVMDMPEVAILTLKKGDQDSVTVTINSKASEHDGKTKISITHVTNKKPS